MIKCQFHTHVKGDPYDYIGHSAKELIKKAAELNYDVLSITTHKKVIFNKSLQKFAKKLGILLIPGTEFEINGKHILGINITDEINHIDNFEKLAKYKIAHPECLIVAPHPFFPGKSVLGKELINNIMLFDAIENSFCYTKKRNYNTEAIKLAHRWKKPIIATSDVHRLNQLNFGYCLIDAKKNWGSILNAIKKNKIKNFSSPMSYGKLIPLIILIQFGGFLKKLKSVSLPSKKEV